jgi:hypothetical protein
MEISKAAVGIIASMSLVAGAGGAWLATRGESAPPAVTDQAPASGTTAPTGVEQSEGTIADAPAETAPNAAPSSAPALSAPAPSAPARTPAPAPRARATAPRAASQPTPAASQPAHPAPAPAQEERPQTSPVFDAPRIAEAEPPKPSAPPEPQFIDLVIPADAVIGLQVDTPVSSETARVEDQVVARVTRDVKVGNRVAIPSGAKAQGEVTLVERGGKLKDRARLGVRFTSIVLADGTRVPIETDTIMREGDGQASQSAAKIGGGAIGGAIIGGIIGGAKGAVIGATAGGGAGSAAVMAGGRSTATLSAGSPVTVRLEQPATVTVDK